MSTHLGLKNLTEEVNLGNSIGQNVNMSTMSDKELLDFYRRLCERYECLCLEINNLDAILVDMEKLLPDPSTDDQEAERQNSSIVT